MVFFQISHLIPFHFSTVMFSDQCVQNPDGTLKDVGDIQWFNDPDDAGPLLGPNSTSPLQPLSLLGRGHYNKTTNHQYLNAVAHEQLCSDEELSMSVLLML